MSPRGAYRNRLNQWYDEKRVRQGKPAAKPPCLVWVIRQFPSFVMTLKGGSTKLWAWAPRSTRCGLARNLLLPLGLREDEGSTTGAEKRLGRTEAESSHYHAGGGGLLSKKTRISEDSFQLSAVRIGKLNNLAIPCGDIRQPPKTSGENATAWP